MAIVVNTNISSIHAWGRLTNTNRSLGEVFERLSSGNRINRAADDAAGLGVSENLDAERISLRQALRNANDGISALSTLEGVAAENTNLLKRIRELAVQAASETLASEERSFIHAEYSQLAAEMNRIESGTMSTRNFGFMDNGTDPTYSIQIGTSASSTSQLNVDTKLIQFGAETLGIGTDVMNLSTTTAALSALTQIDTALNSLNSSRASIGAYENRLESVIRNLMTYNENINAAYSRIRDADFAWETAQLAKYQILQQSGVAVLGQANALSQAALNLLG